MILITIVSLLVGKSMKKLIDNIMFDSSKEMLYEISSNVSIIKSHG